MSHENELAASAALPPASASVAVNGVALNASSSSPDFDIHVQLPSANSLLELADGSKYEGISFGATGKSVAGECVFQTGESADSNPNCIHCP